MTEQTTTDSVRDVLEASYEAVQEADNPVAATESTPVESESTPEGYESPAAEKPAEEAEKASREYNRDEAGKFAEKKAEEAKKTITPGPKGGQPKGDPVERAPQAWKPEAREFWNQIPEAARREIIRTEQNIQQTLRDTVEDRRLAGAVRETIRPFEHLIKAEGGNPIQAIDNLMTTAARLRTGNAYDVAGLVTQIVTQFGIGRFGNDFIRTLDSTLSGQAPKQQVDPYVQQMEQRVQAMERAEQERMSQIKQQQDSQINQAIQQFSQNAEFLEDVRMDMADIIEFAEKRGQSLTLQEAYDRACWANPEIRNVMEQRRDRERMQQQNQVAQKARSAAVSVGGSPAFNASQEAPSDLRSAIEFAMRK